MSSHAILSPSSAYRWLACTPSARFEEQYPDEESVYAREGTIAHEVAALVLSSRAGIFTGNQNNFNAMLSKLEYDAKVFYEKQGKPSEFAAMFDHAEDYANFVRDQATGEILIEQRYKLTEFVPLGYGTADSTNITKDTIYVTDYKYGAGVRVAATANKQMMLYGLGAYLQVREKYPNIKTVVLSIFQPRAGGSSTWQISVEDLLKWAKEEVAPKAKIAMAGIGDFVAGDHCQFCKAKTVCKAFYDRFAEVKKIKDKRVMDDADTADVLTFGPSVASWVKKVEEETINKLSKGGKLKGFKLVAGRGRRSFKSEDEVVDILLGEGFESYDIFDPKLRSLTDLEKQFGKKKFNDLLGKEIIKIEGKPTLTTEDDDRPAIGASAADEFDEDDLT